MAPRKHCACDRTSESLISPSLEFFDTVHEPFVNLVGKVSDVRDSILWLNPFRGIPKGPRLSRFDAIFLDDDGKVMGRAENYAEVEFRPLESKAASALIFPPHTLNSVRINEGDQLRICGGGRILLESAELLATLENEKQLSDEQAKCFKMHAGAATSVDTTDLRESRPIRTHAEEWTKTSEAGNWTLKQRFLAWLIGKKVSNERRLAARLPNPGLVAYHWTGGPQERMNLAT